MSRFCVLLMGCSITDLRRNLSTNARRDLPAITSVTCVSRACHVRVMCVSCACHVRVMSEVANCSTNVGAVELHDFDIHLFELDAASARVAGGSASYCARRRGGPDAGLDKILTSVLRERSEHVVGADSIRLDRTG